MLSLLLLLLLLSLLLSLFYNFIQRVHAIIEEVRRDPASTLLPYASSGVGRDPTCPIQIIVDNDVDGARIDVLHSEGVYNCLKIRFRNYKCISRAIAACKAAQSKGWSVIIGADEDAPEVNDTFISDFAVGIGAGQINVGGLSSGEFFCKCNRLLEIYREDELIRFVGRSFRKK